MRWRRLDEPVKVRADFQGGAVSPVLIRRGDRALRVRSVNTRWRNEEAAGPTVHVSVTLESGELVQLRFDTATLHWRLEYELDEG